MLILRVFGSSGSEGIPCINCKCRTCRLAKPRRRTGYLIETGKFSLWLGLSPDFRQQILEYGNFPNYIFVSHIHFDHFSGIKELIQSFLINKQKRKINLILPNHIFSYLKDIKPFARIIKESSENAFWKLYENKKINLIVVESGEKIKIRDCIIKVINNVHGDILSSSLFLECEKKKFLYLADANKLDEEIYNIAKQELDLIIAHAPFIYRKEDHLGIEDLKDLNAKKIIISHLSHKLNMSEEEIIKEVKKHGEKFEIAYDEMLVKF